MALRIGSLYVSLTANSTGLVKGFAEAAKAAEKVAKDVKRASAEVAQVAGTFAALGGAAVKLAASVDGPTKQAMAGLERSTKVLAVQIADMLLPAVKAISDMFRTMAGVVAGLDPETKKSISNFAVLAVQLAVAAKALSLVASISGNVFGALRAVAAAVAAIGVGPLLSFGIAIAGVIALAVLLHRAWRKNWGGIQEATASVVDWLRDAFGQLANFVGGVWGFLVDGAAKFIDGLLNVGEAIERITGKSLGVAGMREGFAGLFKDLKSGSFFSDAFKFGKGIGQQVVEGLSEEFALIQKELGLDRLFKGGKTIGLGRGMGPKSSSGSGHEGVADMAMAAHADAAARALADIAKEAAAFKKSLADVDAAQQVRQWLKELERLPAIISKAVSDDSGGSLGNLQSVDLADPRVRPGRFGGMSTGGKVLSEAAKDGLAKAADAHAAAVEKWKAIGAIALRGITGALGKVGELINAAVQGAQSGGVWGAIIAVIMEVVQETKAAMEFVGTAMNFVKTIAAMVEPLVKPVFDVFTDLLGVVMNALGPIIDALKPFADSFTSSIKNLMPVFVGIGRVLGALAPVIEVIGNLTNSLTVMAGPLFDLIGGALKVVATVILGIIIGLNELAAAFGDEAARAESDRLKGLVDKMWAPGADELAVAEGKAAGAALRNADAQDDAARAAQKATESLTNVPSGYKLALGRFTADMGITNAFSGGGAGGGTTINGDVFVTSSATTINDLAQDTAREARRERGQERGNPNRGRGRGGDN